MKKLIIATAIVCVAAVSQASTVNWGITTAASLDTTKFASGTAYLICVDDLARPTTLTEQTAGDWYNANKSKFSSAFRTADVANGAIYESEVIESPTGRKNYWLLIDNNETVDDKHYFAISTTTKALNIQAGTMNQTAAWGAASQMATYNVPEPTSGLLMLLGMAGLALRRRRA